MYIIVYPKLVQEYYGIKTMRASMFIAAIVNLRFRHDLSFAHLRFAARVMPKWEAW